MATIAAKWGAVHSMVTCADGERAKASPTISGLLARRDCARQREDWIETLSIEQRTAVFELDTLVRALATFAHPRNHAGPSISAPVVSQNFHEHAEVVRDALVRLLALVRAVAGDVDRMQAFSRYVDSVSESDDDKPPTSESESPQRAIGQLRESFTDLLEIARGIHLLPRVPFRIMHALLSQTVRSVAHTRYFSPVGALEFRAEFDRIADPQLAELARAVQGEGARRLVTITLLSLLRLIRYTHLLEAAALPRTATATAPSTLRGEAYFLASVFIADARALGETLRHRAGSVLADSYEHALFAVPAAEIASRFDELLANGHRLLEIRAMLEAVGANLRLEVRRALGAAFPPADGHPPLPQLQAAIARAGATLRPCLQHAIVLIGRALGAKLDEDGVFSTAAAKRLLSERLRRNVWMFAEVVRAFTEAARGRDAASAEDEAWDRTSPLHFIREFLAYFRAIGYPLLRTTDYPRFDAFMQSIHAVEESDLAERGRLASLVSECERFQPFLIELFHQIGHRDELAGVLFDQIEAAETLRLYVVET